jgi:asparagine N-glycosylation enzyme membrane subunit Stt3
MNKHYIILILLFIISISIACVGIKDCYHPEEDNFYEKYNLRGPDSYYNMKMCKYQLFGNYDIYDYDLAYPYGDRERPLLFTTLTTNIAMITHGISGLSIPDALGWTMLLIPCLFGALVVFPVYGIAKEFFGKNVALLSSVFVIITPFLYSASHGSLAGLFDHDSFIMFFTIMFFYGYIKLIKENKNKRIFFYLMISALSLSAIYMTWVVHEFIFVSLGVFIFMCLLASAILNANPLSFLLKTTLMLDITFVITLWYAHNFHFINNIIFYSAIGSLTLFLIYFFFKIHERHRMLQIGAISSILGLSLIAIYFLRYSSLLLFSPIKSISRYLFGAGIYETKIMSTIQEAQITNLSTLMLGFGFVLFIIAILGFVLYLHKIYRDGVKAKDLFLITMFAITLYFSTEAGRFAKDIIPFIAIFGALFLYAFVKEIDIKKLKELRPKALMSCTLVFLVFSGCIYMTVENVTSADLFNEDEWSEICVDMDSEFGSDTVLAWWDYGFYITSITNNPVIADNFQNGIFVTCNFFTAQSEKEALNVLSIYLIKAEYEIYRQLYQPTLDVINKHLRTYKCNACGAKKGYNYAVPNAFIEAIKNSTDKNDLYENALLYLSKKTIEETYDIFKEIQASTGFYITYVIVDEREITDIKVILPYLANKSTVGFDTYEDDWFKFTVDKIENREKFNNSFIMQLYKEKNIKYFEKIYEKYETKIWRIEE